MKKKILMIYPETPVTYWSFKHSLKFTGKKSSYPPLGLLTVASMVPDNYDITLLDMDVSPLKNKIIADADLVFISAMLVQKNSFQSTVELCKKLGKTIIAGGPYPSSSYTEISNVDTFIINECENTIMEFFEDFESGKTKKLYSSNTKPDLVNTPSPRFDLLDMNKYHSMGLQFSRGCPFQCEFCDIISMFGRRPRTKDVGQFIGEMDDLYSTGFRGPLFIVDDNFIGNRKKVKELLPAIRSWQKKRNYPFILFTEASINLSDDDELMEMMVNAGFNMVFIGIETPVEESLHEMKKMQNTGSNMAESIKKIQNYGLEVTGGFIVGFDSDPDNIFDLQIDFIQRAGIPMAMVGLLMALPNTKLYNRLKRENRLTTDSSGNNTHDMMINFIPRMETNKLISGYKKIIREIYRPDNYFDRCMTFIMNMPEKNTISTKLRFMEIRAMLLSFILIIFSSHGLHYIKLMVKTIVKRPKLFPEAVRLAIQGQHLIKITNYVLQTESFKSLLDNNRKLLRDKIELLKKYNIPDPMETIPILIDQLLYSSKKEFKKLNRKIRQSVNDIYSDFNSTLIQMLYELEQKLSLEKIQPTI